MKEVLRLFLFVAIEGNHFTARAEIRNPTREYPYPLIGNLIIRGHVPTMLSHIRYHVITWALKRQKNVGGNMKIYLSAYDRLIFHERLQAALRMLPVPAGVAFYANANLCTPFTYCQINKLKKVQWEVHGQAMAEEYAKATAT